MGLILESGVVELLYAFLLVFWVIYLYFVKDYGYWEQRQVPHVPAVFPFGSIGQTLMGRCSWNLAFDKVYKDFERERYVGFTEVRSPCLLIRDPALIKLIMQKDFNHFMNHGVCEVNPKDYMMKNLFHLNGREWKEMRQKLTPAYTAAKMKMMFYIVKKSSDLLREVFEKLTEEDNVVDVKDILSRFCMDIIASCAFGVEIDSLCNKDSEIYKAGRDAMTASNSALFKYYLYQAFPILTRVYFFDFYNKYIKDLITDMVRTNVEYRERFAITRFDFLDLLIKLRQNQSILEEGERPPDLHETCRSATKEGLTIEEITAQTFHFFAAGFETTSNTIMFCLYELACHCHIQDTLSREVEEVLSRHGDKVSYAALQEMTYMDMVIKETLRRYPPLPYLMRKCTQSYKIPNSALVLEEGLKLIIPAYSLHHDDKYFPDPYTFDPERFSPESIKERQHSVYLPFGEGPRICIGYRFGQMKIKTALATLLSEYTVSLASDTPVPLQLKPNSWTTMPSQPIMLVFTKKRSRM